MDELLATLLSWIVGSALTAALLWLDRRRLDEDARRAWHRATLYLAVSGFFFPAPLAVGAHLWVTRRLPAWQRIPLALAGSALALSLSLALTVALLSLAGVPVE